MRKSKRLFQVRIQQGATGNGRVTMSSRSVVEGGVERPDRRTIFGKCYVETQEVRMTCGLVE